ncbi:reverse transcriptase domain-containing protein [Tanacetum coccineum]
MFASATQQMVGNQKRSSGEQNLSANREGRHKCINGIKPEQRKHVRLGAIVGIIGGNKNRKRLREQLEMWTNNEILFPFMPGCQLVDSPIILEALIEGFLVQRIYVDGGSSSEGSLTKGREESPGQTDKVEEPDGTIQLSPIPSKKDTQTDEKGMGKGKPLEKSLEDKPPVKVVIHDDYPDQTIIIIRNLSTKCRSGLVEILRKHAYAFAWTPTDMTRIPHFIAEHELKTYPHIEPRVQRKRSIAPDRRKVVKDEVAEWLKARIVRKTLKKVNMKLNPKKCSFGMVESKFLGYIVTSEGIRANPKKAKAVVNMPSPSNLKQMQRLSSKLAALNRFLSKAAERALPCLDTLRKCINKKDFYWTTEAEEAFQAMKKLIAELPALTAPKKEEELMVYLSAANEAISVVLLVEREGRQASIHYVITDKLINQILINQEATGRLAKWGIKLEAYGIKYAPRSMIKGQVFADFLVDTMAEDSPTQVKTKDPNKILVEGESMEEHEAIETKAPKHLRTEADIWKLYTDGASKEHGSRAGIILVDPKRDEYPYALRLNFANSNKYAEYKALLAGLRIATKMKVEKMHAFVDSKLVASQVEGSYEAKGEKTKKYKEKALEMIRSFNNFQISHIPREENRKADALKVNAIIEEATKTWMAPIQEYIEKKILPEDATKARTIREKARNHTIEEGVMYRKSYLGPLLRCIGPQQAKYLIKEIHIGSCRMHDGPRRAVHKAMDVGYFWPNMHRDANHEISSCDSCQVYATIQKLPKNDMISVTSAWPFRKCGMDIVGPLLEAPGKIKYLIIAAEGLGIKLVSTSVYHPQANGAVERANRSIMQGIKTRLHQEGGAWVEELPNVLWAHKTTPKTSNGETPFSLTHGTEAVIPAEIGIPTRRTIQGSDKENEEALRMNLNLLEERREIATIREAR